MLPAPLLALDHAPASENFTVEFVDLAGDFRREQVVVGAIEDPVPRAPELPLHLAIDIEVAAVRIPHVNAPLRIIQDGGQDSFLLDRLLLTEPRPFLGDNTPVGFPAEQHGHNRRRKRDARESTEPQRVINARKQAVVETREPERSRHREKGKPGANSDALQNSFDSPTLSKWRRAARSVNSRTAS